MGKNRIWDDKTGKFWVFSRVGDTADSENTEVSTENESESWPFKQINTRERKELERVSRYEEEMAEKAANTGDNLVVREKRRKKNLFAHDFLVIIMTCAVLIGFGFVTGIIPTDFEIKSVSETSSTSASAAVESQEGEQNTEEDTGHLTLAEKIFYGLGVLGGFYICMGVCLGIAEVKLNKKEAVFFASIISILFGILGAGVIYLSIR